MTIHLQISNNGRVIIPKKVRDSLGIKLGGTVVANLLGDTLQITSAVNSLKHARELVKKYCKDDKISLVDELLVMRREEFKEEQKAYNITKSSND